MYNVGDKVVYPMHGAGVIEAIEEREVLGERRSYYIMGLPVGGMKVMIPLTSEKELGLRDVIDQEGYRRVVEILVGSQSVMSKNWNQRYRANMDKIKSGSIYLVAEVVRNLSIRDKEKGLSTGERKMLDVARQILVSELVLVKNATEEQVESFLVDCIQ